MGLDIYAGTLTRYYNRDWETIVQSISEANGQKCVITNGLGNEIKPVEDEAEIKQTYEIICSWANDLVKSIDSIDPSLPSKLWDERSEQDYFTDKPDWMAYGALVMLQACHLQNCLLPGFVENGWNAYDEPVVKKSMLQEIDSSLLSDVTLWLPIDKKAIFVATSPSGDEAHISTLPLLKQELEELNRHIWNADEATILSWRDDKYYIPVNRKESKPLFGFLFRKRQKDKFRTEDLAQCAFSILYQAVNFAIKHKVPLLLDY